jgi:hypothetical protein
LIANGLVTIKRKGKEISAMGNSLALFLRKAGDRHLSAYFALNVEVIL